jgi:hypothetical protein
MKTIKFNTQRAYGPKGQRIAARLLANGSTVFVDVDRNIEGVIPVLCDVEFTESIFNYRWVMESYDSNHYAQPWDEEHFEVIRELRALILTPATPAPAAPLVAVQTEFEYADGVEEHDYVVTGCHDEDNTEPEPAPQATPAIQWLRLTRDIANPRRDRRMRHGWQSVDTFKAGTVFEVWPDSDGTRSVWFGTMGIGDLKLEAALIDAGEPTIGQDFEEIKKIAGHGYALGSNVIDYALAQGWLTRDQILQALAAGATE